MYCVNKLWTIKLYRLSVIVSGKFTKLSVRKMLRREIVRLNRINKGALFICDLQEKFRPLIKVVLNKEYFISILQ